MGDFYDGSPNCSGCIITLIVILIIGGFIWAYIFEPYTTGSGWLDVSTGEVDPIVEHDSRFSHWAAKSNGMVVNINIGLLVLSSITFLASLFKSRKQETLQSISFYSFFFAICIFIIHACYCVSGIGALVLGFLGFILLGSLLCVVDAEKIKRMENL